MSRHIARWLPLWIAGAFGFYRIFRLEILEYSGQFEQWIVCAVLCLFGSLWAVGWKEF